MCIKCHSIQCIIPPYMMEKLMEKAENKPAAFKTKVQAYATDDKFRSKRQLFSKLSHGAKRVLLHESLKKATKKAAVNRAVYTAKNKETQPGTLVRKEGQVPVKDKDVNRAYDAAGYTWDFYYSLFGRNSIDSKGMKIIQTVHYGVKYDNAFWDGEQMIYGDGDGKIFGSFTTDIDIIGHELTHGVVQYECNLAYKDQSGALNESLADVFGTMIKQKTLNQTVKQADWLIGENCLLGKKYALRSLKAPGTAYVNHPDLGTDPQPATMSGYVNDPSDNGGVHTNSGIPNHAFYVAASAIGGYSWEKTGRIWYAALTDTKLVKANAGFADFKNATITHARKLFPGDSSVSKAVSDAWVTVGV